MSDTFDPERAAQLMFGGAPSKQTAMSTAQPPTSDELLAAKLYPSTDSTAPRPVLRDNRPMNELTDAEQAERLFGGTDPTLTHRNATQAILNAGLEDHLHDPETAKQIAGEWAQTFAEHQLNATESKELADIGAQVLRSPPTPELLAQWEGTAIQNLQQEFGVQGAGQALQDARAYVASVPGAADMLDRLGIGSHPKVVALAAARGRAARLAGKLR